MKEQNPEREHIHTRNRQCTHEYKIRTKYFLNLKSNWLTIQNVHRYRIFMGCIYEAAVVARIWFIYLGNKQRWISALIQDFCLNAAIEKRKEKRERKNEKWKCWFWKWERTNLITVLFVKCFLSCCNSIANGTLENG